MRNKNQSARGLPAHFPIGLFRYNTAKNRFELMDHNLKRILEIAPSADVKRLGLSDIIKDKRETSIFLEELRAIGMAKLYKVRLRRKTKKSAWADISAMPVKALKHGRASDVVEGYFEDVTRLVKADMFTFEKELFENLLDNIPDAVYFKDRKNRLIKVNDFYADGLKKTKEELVGKTDFAFFPKDQAAQMCADDNRVLKTGKPIIGKIERTLLPNGSWNQVVTTKIPLKNRKGRIVGTMGITRDITEYSQLEDEKLQMSVDAIKALARMHQLRDPYT
ncbi:MAG: PAS domain-containing protein, partial [Candidatus Omnitrophota bacterium]